MLKLASIYLSLCILGTVLITGCRHQINSSKTPVPEYYSHADLLTEVQILRAKRSQLTEQVAYCNAIMLSPIKDCADLVHRLNDLDLQYQISQGQYQELVSTACPANTERVQSSTGNSRCYWYAKSGEQLDAGQRTMTCVPSQVYDDQHLCSVPAKIQ